MKKSLVIIVTLFTFGLLSGRAENDTKTKNQLTQPPPEKQNIPLSPGNKVEVEKEQLNNLLFRAESTLPECDNPQAEKLFNQASRQMNYIESVLKHNNPQLALNLIYNTSRMLLRVIDLCRGITPSKYDQAVEELQWLQGMIEWFEIHITANNTPQNMTLQSANRLYDNAKGLIDEEQYDTAICEIHLAKNLLTRLRAQQPSNSVADRAQYELEKIQSEISRIKAANSDANLQIIKAAEQCARDAVVYLQDGKIRLALESILAANRFLPASERTENPNSLNVNQNIILLEEELEACSDENKIDRELYSVAQKMYGQAVAAKNAGQLLLANEYSKIGIDLAQKAKRF
ncbi:hypothetical protein GF407_19010 [candidate division KSB1 bacterium]|nr:hypothetical protein [candidate division KSB1 bacterium]